jgi:TetR/AcrR family transcriptional repressor of nem operon
MARSREFNEATVLDAAVEHFRVECTPREAIEGIFRDIIGHTLGDRSRKGCLPVNAALEFDPSDANMEMTISDVFIAIEDFFKRAVLAVQEGGR